MMRQDAKIKILFLSISMMMSTEILCMLFKVDLSHNNNSIGHIDRLMLEWAVDLHGIDFLEKEVAEYKFTKVCKVKGKAIRYSNPYICLLYTSRCV